MPQISWVGLRPLDVMPKTGMPPSHGQGDRDKADQGNAVLVTGACRSIGDAPLMLHLRTSGYGEACTTSKTLIS